MSKTLIETYYKDGIFTDDDLKLFVLSGDITDKEMDMMKGGAENGR